MSSKSLRSTSTEPDGERDIYSIIEQRIEPMGGAYKGVYAPVGFLNKKKTGVGEFFLENADEYHKRYFNLEDTKPAVKKAIQMSKKNYGNNPVILDLGSGTGNSVFSLVEIYPKATILATDISPQMVTILGSIKNEYYPAANIGLLAVDALEITIEPGTVDIVSGCAFLHHCVYYEKMLDITYKALNNNGVAIFLEPMMSIYIPMSAMLNTIIKMNGYITDDPLDSKVIKHFQAFIRQWKTRIEAMEHNDYKKVKDYDDKWFFSREKLTRLADSIGFKKCLISPMYETDRKKPVKYITEMRGILHLIDLKYECLPTWARDIVETFDRSDFSPNHNDLAANGIIVLLK